MESRKARWAMWSVGSIANRVAVEMAASEKLEVVAVCSSSREKAQSFIDRHGFAAAVPYTDIDEVLRRDDVDIIYISSPPNLHRDHCCRCLRAGKGVLCEKPLTLNLRDAEEIFSCAEENGVFMAEGVWSNYFPAMKQARTWIDEGRIGEVIEVISTFGFPLDALRDPNDMSRWGNRLSSGGGALAQFGCYCVNAAQYVFGEEPEAICGRSELIGREDGFDQTDRFIMTYQNDRQHAMISCSFSARTMSETVIAGTAGNIVLGNPFFAPFHARLYTHGKHFWYNDLDAEFRDPYESAGREGFRYQFESVSDYVLRGLTEAPEVSHAYSLALARTMQRIRKELRLIP